MGGPMILRLWIGYVVSVVSAAVVFVLLGVAAALLGYFPRGYLIDVFYIFVFVSLGILLTAWPFFLITCMIGENEAEELVVLCGLRCANGHSACILVCTILALGRDASR
jgi:hypothetical protein